MSCAVNLLPESCHNARRRAVRRNVWSALVTTATLLLISTWVVLRATSRDVQRLNGEFESVQARQAELERQLTLAARLRNDLAQRARALSALRRESRLPRQLLTLAREAPAGVVFTEIRSLGSVEARSTGTQPPGPRYSSSSARPGSSAENPSAASPLRIETPGPTVQFCGYAVNHDELARLIDALQRIPQWEQVQLLRAAREPYSSGTAIAFRLECRPGEIPR